MRSIDNQLPTIFNYRAELVAGLSANPQFIVMTVKQRHDSFVLAICVTNVDLAANSTSLAKCFSYVSCEQRVGDEPAIVASRNNAIQRDDPRFNKITSRFNQMARGRLDLANYVFNYRERT